MIQNLSFGCSKLTSNLTVKRAIVNLETAFENGIQNFDVARSYGFGAAENIVGIFSKNKRDKIFITTKAGIKPGRALKNLYLQNAARTVFKAVNKIKSSSSFKAKSGVLIHKGNFDFQSLQKSFETSLRELKTDYIDRFLLHEPSISDMQNEDVICWLQNLKQKGLIREFGTGCYAEEIKQKVFSLPTCYTLFQTDCSFPYSLDLPEDFFLSRKTFLFSPFKHAATIKALLNNNAAVSLKINQLASLDSKQYVITLCLIHSLASVRNATIIFTSSDNNKIKNTITQFLLAEKHMHVCKENLPAMQSLFQNFLKQ